MTSLKVIPGQVVFIIRKMGVKQELYMIRRTKVVQPEVRDTMFGIVIFKKERF